jgi:hypothetical protein
MSKRLLLGLTLAALATVAAMPAVSAPRQTVTMEQAAQFKVGVATYDDVIAVLGKPQAVINDSSGNRTIVYTSYRSHVKAMTYVPIVGLFAGGAKADLTSVTFTFGPDGKLTQSSAGDTNVNCSIGSCN